MTATAAASGASEVAGELIDRTIMPPRATVDRRPGWRLFATGPRTPTMNPRRMFFLLLLGILIGLIVFQSA
jgi:hypothetical protein